MGDGMVQQKTRATQASTEQEQDIKICIKILYNTILHQTYGAQFQ